MKYPSRTPLRIVSLVSLVSLHLLACGQVQEQRAKDEPKASPRDSGAIVDSAAASPPRVEWDRRAPFTDASVPVRGGVCSARKVSDRCVRGEISFDTITAECVERTREGFCGMTLHYDIDEQGCVQRVFTDGATEKVLGCFADVLGSRRWPCAEKGEHSWGFPCGPR